jgi:hypothetical protein
MREKRSRWLVVQQRYALRQGRRFASYLKKQGLKEQILKQQSMV